MAGKEIYSHLIEIALTPFREKFPHFCGHRHHQIRIAISRCFISPKVLPVFNQLLFSVIKYVGECVVEDEKLFKFGGGGPVIYEPNKSDVKGL